MDDVLVVGGGVAGLATAARLACRGFRVRLLEMQPHVGGKVRSERVSGEAVSAGPSVLTMPWVFEELFDDCGGDFWAEVSCERAGVLARHAWTDGTRFDLFADLQASVDAVRATFGPREADTFRDFMKDAERIYRTVEGPFIRAHRPGISDVLRHGKAVGFSSLLQIDGHRALWSSLGRFREPRLRQLFGRYATYCGASPFEAPATLALVAHVEASGVIRVAGGIPALTQALARLCVRNGVDIVPNAKVERIEVTRSTRSGVVAGEVRYEARATVFCGDISGLSDLVGGDEARAMRVPLSERSLSAVTYCAVGHSKTFPLLHHNVFFSDDYKAEFTDVFERARTPREPTVYVCAPDRGDVSDARATERLFFLVNAPATGDRPGAWSTQERNQCKASTFRMLERCGAAFDLSAMRETTPEEFHERYPGTGGALYGQRPKGIFASFKRQGARTRMSGLYLAGGSVHPGPGVPMAALSGALAAEAVEQDLRSTRLSPPAATSGTISMP
ncbi:MAG: phytoene desaturase family protein [Polyangiaceae bacterium]